jgi:hypothetical protein
MKRQGDAISTNRDEEMLRLCRSNATVRWHVRGTAEFDLDAGMIYANVCLLSVIRK